jgi:hypothetical protein
VRNLAEYLAYARVLTVAIAQGGGNAVEALVYPGRGDLPRELEGVVGGLAGAGDVAGV